MLRHARGYKLANDGIDTRSLQAYLGHRNIQNTTRYTALAPDRFKGSGKIRAGDYPYIRLIGCGLLKVHFAPNSDPNADVAEGPSRA